MIQERREKKLKASKVRAILAKRAALVTGAKPKKKKKLERAQFSEGQKLFHLRSHLSTQGILYQRNQP